MCEIAICDSRFRNIAGHAIGTGGEDIVSANFEGNGLRLERRIALLRNEAADLVIFDNTSFVWCFVKISDEVKGLGDVETIRS
jgi:hypothetical protein